MRTFQNQIVIQTPGRGTVEITREVQEMVYEHRTAAHRREVIVTVMGT